MNKTTKILIIVNLLALIGYFNWSIMAKEKIITEGDLVLLKLQPVDPRSLMQGDYMQLDYVINQLEQNVKIPKRGFCVVKKDKNGIMDRVRFQEHQMPLGTGEMGVKYFTSNQYGYIRVHVGAESYFFEEGHAKRFENAKFGGLKVDKDGNSVLVGLYNEKSQLIKP